MVHRDLFLLMQFQLGWILWHIVQNGMYPSRPNESKNAIERKLVGNHRVYEESDWSTSG